MTLAQAAALGAALAVLFAAYLLTLTVIGWAWDRIDERLRYGPSGPTLRARWRARQIHRQLFDSDGNLR